MTQLLPLLPPILILDGEWESNFDNLYKVFEQDFKIKRPRHDRKVVVFDQRILVDGRGKEEGFWHLITRTDYGISDRLIDFRRAERLPWAKALIEARLCEDVVIFDYDGGNSRQGIKRYIWLKSADYLVILRKRKNIFVVVSAMHIDGDRKRADLERKYSQRI